MFPTYLAEFKVDVFQGRGKAEKRQEKGTTGKRKLKSKEGKGGLVQYGPLKLYVNCVMLFTLNFLTTFSAR